MLKLFNTLTKKKETFLPLSKKKVTLYTCGPTVYNYAHIGNLRTYIFEDILKRVLISNNYKVKHVMNITDVGHLTSDADEGEDKMEKSARQEGKSAWKIAEFYTKKFKKNLHELNISEPDIWCKATQHIKEQINWIKKLEKKGFTYRTSDGIYYDTSKFKNYGILAKSGLKGLKEGARVEKNPEKKNPSDFALWKFSPTGQKRQMEWSSPWGTGFPGWHLECSVMAQKYLGETIDIHCGGVDHIAIHHTNEIAQAEAVTGKKFVNYWLHGEFLIIGKNQKMAKSEKNFITLDTLKEKNITPLAYRYFTLNAHYRSKLNFSWEALKGAQIALNSLLSTAASLSEAKIGCAEYEKKFIEAANNDLNIPKSLSILWQMLKSNYPDGAKKASLIKMDKILGLGLESVKPQPIPKKIIRLAEKRNNLRNQKKWAEADKIRKAIESEGYEVSDSKEGFKINKKLNL